MTAEATFHLLRESIVVLFALSLPLLLAGLVVGTAISLVQAATQVQEASLVFVPKLLAVAGVFWLTAPWMSEKIITFCHEVFSKVAEAGGGGGII